MPRPPRDSCCHKPVAVGVGASLLALGAAASLGALGVVGDAISQLGPLPVLGGAALVARGARGWWRVAAALAALLATAWLVLPLGTRWPAPADGAPVIRVVEFNSWLENRAPLHAAAWIRARRPDVVVLLEGADASRPLADALAVDLPYRTTCNRDGPCSTMILSRVAPVERRGLAHGDADNHRALSAAYARFASPGPGFAVLAVHLSHSWPWGRQDRESRALLAAMAGTPSRRLIVAGDFNASPWSNTLRRIARGLGVSSIGGEAASWPAPPAGIALPPLLRIDHVLLGPGWRAARSARGPSLGSDHYPFAITLAPGS